MALLSVTRQHSPHLRHTRPTSMCHHPPTRQRQRVRAGLHMCMARSGSSPHGCAEQAAPTMGTSMRYFCGCRASSMMGITFGRCLAMLTRSRPERCENSTAYTAPSGPTCGQPRGGGKSGGRCGRYGQWGGCGSAGGGSGSVLLAQGGIQPIHPPRLLSAHGLLPTAQRATHASRAALSSPAHQV